jgi:hypothetical protein
MFCPKCRGEFREGISNCKECSVPLVAQMPPAPQDSIWDSEEVTLLVSYDGAVVETAKNRLEQLRIWCWVTGGHIDMLGDRGGNNGPFRINVRKVDAKAAVMALKASD